MTSSVETQMLEHVRRVLADPVPPPPGQGQTWSGDVATRVGRFPLPDGRYYADAAYPVEEGYDDDFGSRTCRRGCPYAGQAHEHCHRVADTLEGLLAAATAEHMARPRGL